MENYVVSPKIIEDLTAMEQARPESEQMTPIYLDPVKTVRDIKSLIFQISRMKPPSIIVTSED